MMKSTIEIWRDIKDYEGLYKVSNLGRVRSVDHYVKHSYGGLRLVKGKLLSINNINGYSVVSLSKNGKTKTYKLHRLVAQTFISNPNNKPHIDHINTIRTDNRVENLRWVTVTENHNNPLSLEHLSNAIKGHVVSEETKEKIRQKHLGKRCGSENPNSKKIKQLTLNNELIRVWDCLKDACNELNICSSCISSCLSGRYKSAGGYHWELV